MHALFINVFAIVRTRGETTTFATADAFNHGQHYKGNKLVIAIALVFALAIAFMLLLSMTQR